MIRALPGTAALLLLLTACDDPDRAPEPGPSAPPVSAAPHSNDDQRRAEAAVLTLADAGQGFRGAPQAPDPRADEDDATLSACLGRPPTRTRETARALSPALTQGDARRIRAGVAFVSSEAEATADLEALRSGKAAGCLADLMRADLGRQGVDAEVSVEPLSTPVPDAVGFSLIVIARTADGRRLPSITDYLAAIKGRAEVDAYFQDVNGHVDAATTTKLMTVMLERL